MFLTISCSIKASLCLPFYSADKFLTESRLLTLNIFVVVVKKFIDTIQSKFDNNIIKSPSKKERELMYDVSEFFL